jgi:hypothetical protein
MASFVAWKLGNNRLPIFGQFASSVESRGHQRASWLNRKSRFSGRHGWDNVFCRPIDINSGASSAAYTFKPLFDSLSVFQQPGSHPSGSEGHVLCEQRTSIHHNKVGIFQRRSWFKALKHSLAAQFYPGSNAAIEPFLAIKRQTLHFHRAKYKPQTWQRLFNSNPSAVDQPWRRRRNRFRSGRRFCGSRASVSLFPRPGKYRDDGSAPRPVRRRDW